MRNIPSRLPARDKKRFAAKLKQIWLQPDRKSALRLARLFIAELRRQHPEAVETLRERLEDSLQFYALEASDPKKISSNNIQDNLHKQIRRRPRVVGVFPCAESYLRLVTSYRIEYSEDCLKAQRYMRKELVEQCRAKLKRVA